MAIIDESLKKAFVLDTNVILNDPDCIYRFDEHDVIIPMVVLEELEKFKKGNEQINHNTRKAHRILQELVEQHRAKEGVESVKEGIDLSPLSSLRFFPWAGPHSERTTLFVEECNDHKILDVMLWLKSKNSYQEVVLITDDRNLWLKALMLGLSAESFRAFDGDEALLKRGVLDIVVPEDELANLNQHSNPSTESCPTLFDQLKEIKGNVALAIRCNTEDKPCYFKWFGGELKSLNSDWNIQGLCAKNTEQAFALEALRNPEIGVVALTGPAGTGKTLIALLAALEGLGKEDFGRVMIARPIVELSDKTMGFLPGSVDEKIDPYFGPIYDNLEFIRATQNKSKKGENSEPPIKVWAKEKGIEFFALNFLRGRSIPNQLLIVDEAQNMTPHEMKTLITRLGEGSKVVVIGDTQQIDLPYLKENSNGLAYLIQCWSDRPEFFHLHLSKGERSTIASIAAEIM